MFAMDRELHRSTIEALCIAAVGALLTSPPATAVEPGAEIREWRVPWTDTRPRDPFVGPQGRVWFVGQTGDYLASLEPADGRFERYELEAGAGPHNLIVDRDGQVWYAGNRDAHIGRLDPHSREIREYPMPDLAARDPHTLAFGPDGDIWFTVQGGNFVGRLAPDDGGIELAQVPTAGARPYGIVVTKDGIPWFTEFGSNKLGTVDPESLAIEEIVLPRDRARPRRLAVSSDGMIWYVDYADGFLGRFDPAAGEVEEWPVPGGPEAKPYGMAADSRDVLWFVETGPQPNSFVGFDSRRERFTAGIPIASGGGTVRHMHYHAPTETIWFGTDANTIGRASLTP